MSLPDTRQLKYGDPRTRPNQAGIAFALIPAGSFMMGSTSGQADERPVHLVTLNYSFFMGKYEVTQAQWQSVMGNNPSEFKNCGGNCPVEQVSWDDAQSFINKLNKSNDGFRYRLPSEAEWEYACRAGTTGDYAGDLDTMAWYGNNSGRRWLDVDKIPKDWVKRVTENGGQTHVVGTKLPNSLGLFDMHGNVWEWCQDWYHDTYEGAPSDGSAVSGRSDTSMWWRNSRVLRGGSWAYSANGTRSAFRNYDSPDSRRNYRGFRVVAVSSNNALSISTIGVLPIPPRSTDPAEPPSPLWRNLEKRIELAPKPDTELLLPDHFETLESNQRKSKSEKPLSTKGAFSEISGKRKVIVKSNGGLRDKITARLKDYGGLEIVENPAEAELAVNFYAWVGGEYSFMGISKTVTGGSLIITTRDPSLHVPRIIWRHQDTGGEDNAFDKLVRRFIKDLKKLRGEK